MAAERPDQNGELQTWKEIATYLGASVRAVQMWQKQYGLPVRKPQGRVTATRTELDQWKQEQASRGMLPAMSPELANVAAKVGPAEGASNPGAQRPVTPAVTSRWRIAAALVGVIVVVAGAVRVRSWWLAAAADSEPVDYRLNKRLLSVTNHKSERLWEYRFPVEVLPHDPHEALLVGRMRQKFEDIDGDGRAETVIAVYEEARTLLWCFGPQGAVKWNFEAGKAVTDTRGRTFAPPYRISSFEVFAQSGEKRIVTSANHWWSFPTQIAVLDANRRVLGEYWHRGHTLALATGDLNGDGNPEILAAGVNDAPEYRQATLLVFDSRSVGGCSRSPEGKAYFKDMPPGTERAEIFSQKVNLAFARSSTRQLAWR